MKLHLLMDSEFARRALEISGVKASVEKRLSLSEMNAEQRASGNRTRTVPAEVSEALYQRVCTQLQTYPMDERHPIESPEAFVLKVARALDPALDEHPAINSDAMVKAVRLIHVAMNRHVMGKIIDEMNAGNPGNVPAALGRVSAVTPQGKIQESRGQVPTTSL